MDALPYQLLALTWCPPPGPPLDPSSLTLTDLAGPCRQEVYDLHRLGMTSLPKSPAWLMCSLRLRSYL